ETDRGIGPAIGIFADDQPVAVAQRRHHRIRRDIEGLGDAAMDPEDEQQNHHYIADQLAPALLSLGLLFRHYSSLIASMMTKACAQGWSSVNVRWICALCPSGTIWARRCAAPPVSASVGAPDGALTTPMSFMNTPRLKPVPTALEKASFAAKRLA